MGQVTENTIRFILDYAEKGLHFPLTVNELQQLANLAACQLLNPPKHVDWDAVHKAIGKCAQGSYDVASTGTFLTPITSPAKVGGDERETLTDGEFRDLVNKVTNTAKVFGQTQQLRERIRDDLECVRSVSAFMSAVGHSEALGLIEHAITVANTHETGEHDDLRIVTLRMDEALRLRAALSADGGERKDAERWRAFRSRNELPDYLKAGKFFGAFGDDADAIIDAAIAAKAKGDAQ